MPQRDSDSLSLASWATLMLPNKQITIRFRFATSQDCPSFNVCIEIIN